jgi:hypothetical protein
VVKPTQPRSDSLRRYRAKQPDLAGKRLELLRSVVPGLRRLATFVVAASANSALEMGAQLPPGLFPLALGLAAAQSEYHLAMLLGSLLGFAGTADQSTNRVGFAKLIELATTTRRRMGRKCRILAL